MNVKIEPGFLNGSVTAPSSKSHAHRLLICAAIANGASKIGRVTLGDDITATMDCISTLGAKCAVDGDAVSVLGNGQKAYSHFVFPCRESASTLRFLIPLSLVFGESAVFRCSHRLMERGISVFEELFREKNINIKKAENEILIRGKLFPGEYILKGNISSQFVSGLMLALPLLSRDSIVYVIPPVESRPYIDMTIDVIKKFGVTVTEEEKNVFFVRGNQVYHGSDVDAEGDWSNSAVFYAFNSCGSNVNVTGLSKGSMQGDKFCKELFEALNSENPVIDISNCPDLGPILIAVAAVKQGALFVGTGRLAIKESNRAKSMADELKKFGIRVDVNDNSIKVFGGKLKRPSEILECHNDHRVAMAVSFLASVTGGELCGAQCVSKSYPNYFDVITSLGLKAEYKLQNL